MVTTDEDGSPRVTEDQRVFVTQVVTASETVALKHDVRVEGHLVGVDDVEVTSVAKDKNVPWESLDRFNCKTFGD